MSGYQYFLDTCLALHIDTQEMTETFAYGRAESVLSWIINKNEQIDGVTVYHREIGALLFDLSSECKMVNFLKGDKIIVPPDNALCNYLLMLINKTTAHNMSEETLEMLMTHLEITQTKLINEEFVEHQRHVSFKSNRVYATQSLIDRSLHWYVKDELPMSFYKDDNNEDYAVTDMDLVSLVSYYLRTLYLNNLYPRFCINCGRPFIARTYVFDVLCQRDCKKERESDYNRRYKERHNNEYEKLYLKIYRKWYTRLNRSKTAMYNTDPSFIQCQEVFSSFISESYDKRTAVSNGDITPDDFKAWIEQAENKMESFWNLIVRGK